MIFTKTKLNGAFIVELEKGKDKRGFFARAWDYKQFLEHGLNSNLVQCNISFTEKKGTLRGMHYQTKPYQETKLIRCTKGKIFDVIIDLRVKSETFKEWLGIELTADNYKMLYVPEDFAHGFMTLEDDTEIFYQISQYYNPELEQGVRWDDQAFQIRWPLHPILISEKDLGYPSFDK